MKILLYTEGLKLLSKSGVGRAIHHQKSALKKSHVSYTTDLKSDYDIVHINTVGPYSTHLAKKAKRHGKKVILHAHSTEEDFRDSFIFANSVSPLFKKRLIYAYNLADHIVTPTPYSKALLDNYDLTPPITDISNGIDLKRFQKDVEAGKQFRKTYHFTSTDKIILSVGLQIKRKGILDFIDIARHMPEFNFVWCGYTQPYLLTKDVRTAIKSAPTNVHFLGYVTNMIGAYSACDCFFMPTYEETEGIVVLEAMAARCPVVLRDIPVYNEWLTDSIHCYKKKTNDEFIRALQACVNDKDNHSMTDAAYDVVKDRSLEKVGQQLSDLYQAVIGKDDSYALQYQEE